MARTKGAKNKIGSQARENVAAVFTRLGSTAAMAEWASENKTEFYKLYARLIPQQVEADVSVSTEVDLTDAELAAIAAASRAGASEAKESPQEPSAVH